jgi:hypothetical protein
MMSKSSLNAILRVGGAVVVVVVVVEVVVVVVVVVVEVVVVEVVVVVVVIAVDEHITTPLKVKDTTTGGVGVVSKLV